MFFMMGVDGSKRPWMTAALFSTLPEHVMLQQEADLARGLRSLFSDIEFQPREGTFLTDTILLIAIYKTGGKSKMERDHLMRYP